MKLIVLFLYFLVLFVPLSSMYKNHYCLDTVGNYTIDSVYKTNLDKLLSEIATDARINYGFYNFSVGHGADQANAIALCRGDLNVNDCKRCLNSSIQQIKELCSNYKEAILWYKTDCMLRYTSRPIFGIMENNLDNYDCGSVNESDPGLLWKTTEELLRRLQNAASRGDDRRKFATGEAVIMGAKKVYGLVQCTPDLVGTDCFDCLDNTIDDLDRMCYGRQEPRFFEPSCNVMFGTNRFDKKMKRKHIPQLHIVAISAGVLIFLFSLLSLWFCIYKRKTKQQDCEEDVTDIVAVGSLHMEFNMIRAATQNFARDRKLGQGGFGQVYKGTLEDKQDVAVKRLSINSSQGIAEFKTEVLLVAKLQHRNLARLLGFCISGKEKLLVYEFLPNSSLDKHIFDPTKRTSLSWETRFKIIFGIAKGLLYLHEDSRLKIVHRDLKTSNVLLDEAMNPKISDFGLAKLFGVDQTQDATNTIVGTYGYMAPEYIFTGRYSIKSDVYSFGVMVLEVVSGQRNYMNHPRHEEEALLHRAWRLWNESVALNLVDETLGDNFSSEQVIKCIHIGLLCIQEHAEKRPNMTPVVAALGGQAITLPMPSPPSFIGPSSSTSMPNIACSASVCKISNITELHPR